MVGLDDFAQEGVGGGVGDAHGDELAGGGALGLGEDGGLEGVGAADPLIGVAAAGVLDHDGFEVADAGAGELASDLLLELDDLL